MVLRIERQEAQREAHRKVGEFLREVCAAITAGERDAKEGHDVVTVGIYRELFNKCRTVAVAIHVQNEKRTCPHNVPAGYGCYYCP